MSEQKNNQQSGKQEYEIISHNSGNFKVFLVNVLYRTPHAHKDFELGVILEGETKFITQNHTQTLKEGDIFLINPYQSHEIQATSPVLILSLQLPTSFFSAYFPRIEALEFMQNYLMVETKFSLCRQIRWHLVEIARIYFLQEEFGTLRCAALINQLMVRLLEEVETHTYSEGELQNLRAKGSRLRRIIHYIEEHYTEKILLSDIAAKEELDLYYLSHFFTENFGIPFQSYVNKLRCEKARSLLLLTNKSLLEISISLGFSDAKYFNKGFLEQYGCTPKEYRKQFKSLPLRDQQKSMLSSQEFLSIEASLVILDAYVG